MEDLKIPGLSQLRSEILIAASKPSRRGGGAHLLRAAVESLYAEIRDYRIAGHGWPRLSKMIRERTGIPCSAGSVERLFNEIDERWERETDVPSLATMAGGKPQGKRRKGAKGESGND